MPKLPRSPISQTPVVLLPEQPTEPDPSYPTGRHAAALAAFLGELIARAEAAAAAREKAA